MNRKQKKAKRLRATRHKDVCKWLKGGMPRKYKKFSAKGLTTYTFSFWVDDNFVHIGASDIHGSLISFKQVNSIRDVKVFMKQYCGVYDW